MGKDTHSGTIQVIRENRGKNFGAKEKIDNWKGLKKKDAEWNRGEGDEKEEGKV